MKESVIYQEWIETATAEGMARGLAEGRAEGVKQGVKEGETRLILKQLSRRLGNIPEPLMATIQNLSVHKLEELGEALLDFTNMEGLTSWLDKNPRT